MDLSHPLSPYPLMQPSGAAAGRKTSERASGSRFSLKECEQYAASLKRIKSAEALRRSPSGARARTDDAIAEFQANGGHSGSPMKKAAR